MKVLYHHRTRAQDVEGVHIRGIVNALRDLGHQVDVVSPPGVSIEARAPTAGLVRPVRPGNSVWKTVARRAPQGLFEGLEVAYNAYALPRVGGALLGADYDLLYERYALFSLSGLVSASQLGVPFILEVNDSASVDRIRPLRMQAAARRIERYIWTNADAIVTITGYFRDLIIDLGADPDRVVVIPNAAEGGAFAALPDRAAVRAELGLAPDRVVIGYVGAINYWRRLDLLVDAFAGLARQRPRLHLLLVGEGPDREAVSDKMRQLGLEAQVTLAGKVGHDRVPGCLAAMDVAVLPHSNLYGSPMKLFEYMAAGCAVVAPWLPPIVSAIGVEESGVLFRPLDVGHLEDVLGELADDPERRARLGRAARERALSHFVWQEHARRIVALRDEIRARWS